MSKNRNLPLLAYFGHRKCASTWISQVISELCVQIGIKYKLEKIAFIEDFSFIKNDKIEFLISPTCKYSKVEELVDYKAFHVIRDPRDLCVSAYFSHKISHAIHGWDQLQDHRDKLNSLTKEEGIIKDFDFNEEIIRNMASWDYTNENILELKLEDITANYNKAFKEIFTFLGILSYKGGSSHLYDFISIINRVSNRLFSTPWIKQIDSFSNIHIDEILEKRNFSKLTGGRKRGQVNVNSHYRTGSKGDWRNHFTDRHKELFKDKFGDVLINLGYEENNDW